LQATKISARTPQSAAGRLQEIACADLKRSANIVL
jgi:hypothetical protein